MSDKVKEFIKRWGFQPAQGMGCARIDCTATFEKELNEILADERNSAIDECIAVIENNECNADGYHTCTQQNVYMLSMQQLKEKTR